MKTKFVKIGVRPPWNRRKNQLLYTAVQQGIAVFFYSTLFAIFRILYPISEKVNCFYALALWRAFFYSVGKWQRLTLNKEFKALCKVNYFQKHLAKHPQSDRDGSVIPCCGIAEFFCSTENPYIQQFIVYVPIRAPPSDFDFVSYQFKKEIGGLL